MADGSGGEEESLNAMKFLIGPACAGYITSCAASMPPPAVLIDARQAYAHASASPGAQLVPTDVHKAREALVRAEESFRDDPKSHRTRNLAIIAHREARIAAALAAAARDTAITAEANNDFQSTKSEIVKQR
jgi:hypothetical protein